MSDIEYIVQRIKEIYKCCYDDVYINIVELENTYNLELILKGAIYKRKIFEIKKQIESVGEVISYIYKEMGA